MILHIIIFILSCIVLLISFIISVNTLSNNTINIRKLIILKIVVIIGTLAMVLSFINIITSI